MPGVEITEAEVLRAIREAVEVPADRPPATYTTGEISEALGWSGRRVRERVLRPLHRKGRIRPVTVSVMQINGIAHPVPAYQFLEAA